MNKVNVSAVHEDARKGTTKIFITKNKVNPFITIQKESPENDEYWRWGDDNLMPNALAMMARRSTIHRRIINDKSDYISGKGFYYDERRKELSEIINYANGSGESLREVVNKIALDKSMFGNAFLEVVTDENRSFLSLFHQDASKCRLAKDRKHIILHHNWEKYSSSESVKIPLYPNFKQTKGGFFRSIIHYKDYEPMFENYGVPPYIAGMNVTAIAYKTDKWNISRLDNSFQLSGVMILNGDVDNETQAEAIVKSAEKRFAGTPGQVMFLVKGGDSSDDSKFIPISSANEGDWKSLHEQAITDIIVAHSWFRSLSGIDYGSGFSSDRILNEYEIALNTIIIGEQEEILEPIRKIVGDILKLDASSIQTINRPPTQGKPLYMRVWEARRADGLSYDENDPDQQYFLAQVTKYGLKNIS